MGMLARQVAEGWRPSGSGELIDRGLNPVFP